MLCVVFFFKQKTAYEIVRSRGLGDVYKRQAGAGANFVMQSDASGNASWVNVNTLNANNIYNSNGTLTAARTLTPVSYTHLTLPTSDLV